MEGNPPYPRIRSEIARDPATDGAPRAGRPRRPRRPGAPAPRLAPPTAAEPRRARRGAWALSWSALPVLFKETRFTRVFLKLLRATFTTRTLPFPRTLLKKTPPSPNSLQEDHAESPQGYRVPQTRRAPTSVAGSRGSQGPSSKIRQSPMTRSITSSSSRSAPAGGGLRSERDGQSIGISIGLNSGLSRFFKFWNRIKPALRRSSSR